MDQQPKMRREEEEEEGSLKESTGRRTEEEEPVDRREEEEKKGPQEPTTDPREAAADEEKEKEKEDKERSSDEDESMAAAAAVFLHPCSLLLYVVRALACRLGISDPFGGTGTKPSADSAAPPLGPSEEGQDADQKNPGTATGFYMQGVITTSVRAMSWSRPRPPGPDNPVEGSGGNGGHHH